MDVKILKFLLPAWLLITFATNLPMVYAGRSIQGFCVGLTTLALPIYLSEILQPEVRGTLGLLPTTIGNIGILLCYILGSYIDWKILAAIGAALPVPFMLLMWFIPDTPRFLVSKGTFHLKFLAKILIGCVSRSSRGC